MPEIYISPITRPSGVLSIAQRRVLLCGNPGAGKTYTSITTSPNPQVLDIDKGITDDRLVKLNVPTYPIWDKVWSENTFKATAIPNVIMKVLKEHATKLTPEQTLIIDSISSIEDALLTYAEAICPMSKTKPGEKDWREMWSIAKDWWTDFFTCLTNLNCHIIVCAHLAEIRDAENYQIIRGYNAMIDGSMKQEIGRFFTDLIMQIATEKKDGEKVTTDYKWQVKSSAMFTAKCRANIDGLYIPASFNGLINLK